MNVCICTEDQQNINNATMSVRTINCASI